MNRLRAFAEEHPGYVRLYVPVVMTLTFLAVVFDVKVRL